MKKLFILFLCIFTVLGLSIPAEAATNTNQIVTQKEEYSEYQGILDLGSNSNTALVAEGPSPAKNSILDEYEEAIAERAQLPEETLKNYGYSSEQIELLKGYEAGDLSFEQIAASTSATLTSELISTQHTTTKYTIVYTWTWNILPTGLGGDSVALTYNGIDNNSSNLMTQLTSYLCKVNYYYEGTGNFYRSEAGSLDLTGNYLTTDFKSYKQDDLGNTYVWAKSGMISVSLAPAVSGGNTFAAVRANGVYGHATNSGSLSASVSVGYGACSVSFTVSGSAGSVVWGRKQYLFYNNGTVAVEFPK